MKLLLKTSLGFVWLFALIFIVAFFHAFLISISWNYIMPKLFHLSKIGYWDAYVMSILSSCLFRTTYSTKE